MTLLPCTNLSYLLCDGGWGVGDPNQYVRKADEFYRQRKGARKSYPSEGTPGPIRYTKNGKYIIVAPNGQYIFGGWKGSNEWRIGKIWK